MILSFFKKVASFFIKKKEVVTFFDSNRVVGDPRKHIEIWNINLPVDRWWRVKHDIAFGSKAHLEANFIDMLMEFEEDRLFRELSQSDEYNRNTGDWLKHREVVKNESVEEERDRYMKEFNELDLSQFDDKK